MPLHATKSDTRAPKTFFQCFVPPSGSRASLFIMVANGENTLGAIGKLWYEAPRSCWLWSSGALIVVFFLPHGPFASQHSTRLKLQWYIIQFLSSAAPLQVAERPVITLRCSSSAALLYFRGRCLLLDAFWRLLNLQRRLLRHLLGDTLSPQVPLPPHSRPSTVQPRMLSLSHAYQTPKGASSGWCSLVIVLARNLAETLFSTLLPCSSSSLPLHDVIFQVIIWLIPPPPPFLSIVPLAQYYINLTNRTGYTRSQAQKPPFLFHTVAL